MKVVIVGAGPAGLFAAYNLKGHADVTIVDKGHDVGVRKCPGKDKCKHSCKPCNILHGVGGAGLLSDGKINFSNKIGSNLDSIVGEAKNIDLVEDVKGIFESYGVKLKRLSSADERRILELKKSARVAGGEFLYSPNAHVGTDKLVGLIQTFRNDLEAEGVEFRHKTDVLKVKPKTIITDNGNIHYDKLLLAPGRVGAAWLEDIVNSLGIKYSYNPIDIGVRVEVPREICDHITNVSRDMKIHLKTDTYNDMARTFCTCPGGKVARETHPEFNLVNGHSDSADSTQNTNFAFLATIPLTAPLGNTNKYGFGVANLAYITGVGKPILQRLGDIRRGRRSHRSKKGDFLTIPTFDDVIYGDIGLVLPYRVQVAILEGLDKLDAVVPGVANDETLLYAPEIKFHGLRVKTDKYLATNQKNIYVAGDGAGLTRGICGAACCGLLASEGMLKDINKYKK